MVKVAPVNKKIGLGASLLLMTFKALVKLFLWLTVLNVPLLIIFYKGAVMNRPEVTVGETVTTDSENLIPVSKDQSLIRYQEK